MLLNTVGLEYNNELELRPLYTPKCLYRYYETIVTAKYYFVRKNLHDFITQAREVAYSLPVRCLSLI